MPLGVERFEMAEMLPDPIETYLAFLPSEQTPTDDTWKSVDQVGGAAAARVCSLADALLLGFHVIHSSKGDIQAWIKRGDRVLSPKEVLQEFEELEEGRQQVTAEKCKHPHMTGSTSGTQISARCPDCGYA